MAGSLGVSVMSLKDYPCDQDSPGPFYIRAVLNDTTVVSTERKTPRKANDSVMFMEQLVIPYQNSKKDVLKLELLQSAMGGDLVLGECKMRIADVVAAGTVHSWFPFIDAGEPTLKAAELLMAINAKTGKQAQKSMPKNQLPAPVVAKAPTAVRTGTRASNLPVPIALGAAVILGVLSLVKTKRPIYYTVEEGDNLCTIGECFNQDYRMMYDRNKQVITDPHVIYPGDRIRVS